MNKLILIILFSLLSNLSFSQVPYFESNTNKRDSTESRALKHISNEFEFAISFYGTSYWSRQRLSLTILALKKNKWYQITINEEYNPPKGYRMDYANPKTSKKKTKKISRRKVAKLIDVFTENNIWNMNCDSLNINQKINSDSSVSLLNITDGPTYTFEFFTPNKYRNVSTYHPKYFLEQIPEVYNRQNFLNCKEEFNRTIKRKRETTTNRI